MPNMGGAYEASDRFDQSIALWQPALRSPDVEILPEKDILDARALDMTRNDAYILSGQMLHRNHIVGSRYMLSAIPAIDYLKTLNPAFDEKWAEEFQEEVETKWHLYAESSQNYFDASGRNTFTEMVRLAVGTYVPHGEILATVEWIPDLSGYGTKIQLTDPVRLSTPTQHSTDDKVRGGVRFDKNGRPVSYYIRRTHPYDMLLSRKQWDDHKEVRARKKWGRENVIHILEQMRISQTRGVSDMVAALSEMRITKKFRKVTLQNAVLNATYAAAIESTLPAELAFQSLGAGLTADSVGSGYVDSANTYLAAVASYFGENEKRYAHIDGLRIPHMYPGTKLAFHQAGDQKGVGQDFETSLLRYIAANLGVTYEQLSHDYSKTNYSSIRAGLVETIKFMGSRKKVTADSFSNRSYRPWLEEAIGDGHITSMPANAPSWYDGLTAEAYAQADWIGTGRGQIDELKETQAAVMRMNNNLSTLEDEIAATKGKDWRKVLMQRKRERELIDEYGLAPPQENALNALSPEEDEEDA